MMIFVGHFWDTFLSYAHVLLFMHFPEAAFGREILEINLAPFVALEIEK